MKVNKHLSRKSLETRYRRTDGDKVVCKACMCDYPGPLSGRCAAELARPGRRGAGARSPATCRPADPRPTLATCAAPAPGTTCTGAPLG